MAEQALDVQAVAATVRRHRYAVTVTALLGAVVGAGLVVVRPPMYTSTTEVLLPAPVVVTSADTTDTVTQTQIAHSQKVLGPAAAVAAPGLSIRELDQRVQVTEPSDRTLVFQVSAPTAAGAERLAAAVAHQEVVYVDGAGGAQPDQQLVSAVGRATDILSALQGRLRRSPLATEPQLGALSDRLASLNGQLQTISAAATPASGTASVIQDATPAVRPGPLRSYALDTVLGLLCGLAVALLLCALAARRDRRLRTRDRLAATVGKPVLASLQGQWARSTSGWEHLLAHYDPDPVDAWALRKLIQRLPADAAGHRRVTILSLEQDQRGIAFGPLLASYAASTGIDTELVAGALPASAGLTAALHHLTGEEGRPGLQVSTSARDGGELTVVVVTAGDHAVDLELTGPVIVAVSPGTATAERLVRAVMDAEEAGGSLLGVAVVSPDAADRTTGYLRGHGVDAPHDLPRRIPGSTPLARRTEPS